MKKDVATSNISLKEYEKVLTVDDIYEVYKKAISIKLPYESVKKIKVSRKVLNSLKKEVMNRHLMFGSLYGINVELDPTLKGNEYRIIKNGE